MVFSAGDRPATDTKLLRSLRICDTVGEPSSAIASNIIVWKRNIISNCQSFVFYCIMIVLLGGGRGRGRGGADKQLRKVNVVGRVVVVGGMR